MMPGKVPRMRRRVQPEPPPWSVRFALRITRQHVFRVQEIGKALMIFGAVIVLVGAALWSGIGGGWLGRLPGDIRIERGNSGFYFPIVTCIIISIVLSLILSLFRR